MSVPYDYMAAQRESAMRQHPGSFADYGIRGKPIPVAPATTAVAPPQPTVAPKSGPAYPDLIAQLEKQKGGRLNGEELADAANRFGTEVLMPHNISRGAKQFELEALKQAFDAKAMRFNAEYLAQPQAAGGANAANDEDFGLRRGLEVTGDTTVGALSGIASLVPGVFSLADLAYRYSPIGMAQNYAQQLYRRGLPSTDMTEEGIKDRMSYIGPAERTPVGQFAGWLEGQRRQATDILTSQKTLDQRAARDAALPTDPNTPFLEELAAYIGETIKRPSVLSQDIGTGIGSLASPGAAVKGVSTLGKSAPFVQKLLNRLLPAAAIGGPQAGSIIASIEQKIYDRPLDELLEKPENQLLYDTMLDAGIPRESAERRLKDELARTTMPAIVAAEMVANVALPAIPGLGGAERAIAERGTRAASRLRRGATGAVSEATQEGTAGGVEQLGENVQEAALTGKDVPLTAGMGRAVGESGLIGAPVGGLVGVAMPPPQAAPVVPPTNTPPTNTPPAGTPAASPTPTPAAPTAGKGIPQGDLDAALSKLRNKVAQTLAAKNKIKTQVDGLKTAPEAVQAATAFASTAVPNWTSLDPTQQHTVVEAVAAEFAKNKPFAADLPAALQAAGPTAPAAAAPAAPVVTQVPIPPGTIGPAPVAATPDPATMPNRPLGPDGKPQPVVWPPPGLSAEPTPTPAPTPAPVPAPPKKGLRAKPVPAPPTPAPVAETPVPATEAVGTPLPAGLSKAAPRYGYGGTNFELEFESDTEKALYVLGDPQKKSKSDAKYLAWVQETLELNEAEARAAGARVREYIKGLASTAAKGQTKLRVPAGAGQQAEAPTAAPPVEQPPAKAAVPKPPRLRKPKVPPPPKTEAPAPTPATGAQASSSAPQPAAANAPSANRESAADAVQRILGGRISDPDAASLAEAIDLAREGNSAQLEETLREIEVHDGDISFRPPSHAEKVALRDAGKNLSPSQRGEAEGSEPAEAPYVIETPQQSASRVLKNIKGKTAVEAMEWIAENGPDPAYRAIARVVAQRMKQLVQLGARFALHGQNLRPGNHGVTLNNISARSYAASIRLSLTEPTGGFSWETMLHEFIHSVTANMILAATDPTLDAVFGKARGTEIEKAALELDELFQKVKAHFTALPRNERPGQIRASNAFEDANELIAWGLSNPHMQEFLKSISLGPKKETAFSRFVGVVRKFLGIPETHETALSRLIDVSEKLLVTANLEEWAKAISDTGNFPWSDMVLQQAVRTAQDVGTDVFRLTNKIDEHPLPVSTWQTIGELFANSTYGLEVAESEVRKAGGTVDPEISPYYAGRKFGSDQSEIAALDREEVINPIATWINQNWRKFADTVDEFHKYSDQFLQAYHELTERIPDAWRQRVPLNNGMNLARELLIEQAHNGEITPQDFYSRLTDMVNQNASVGLEEWSKTTQGIKEMAGLRQLLADLKKRGYDENTLAEYNAQFDPARKRLQEHMLASGRIAASDPWVTARGWKYYFPLKGTGDVSEDIADADYGSYSGKAREFRSIQIKLAEGRSTFAGSVASQLVSDLHNEGMKLAERSFKESLFSFVMENIARMGGTKITTVRGTLRQGFTRDATVRKNGRKVVVQKEVPSEKIYTEPKYGFVYHNGDTHFIVELDPNNEIAGQLDRGVKGFRNVNSPQGFFKAVGIATNIMARAYTTWSPVWQAMVGFLRDTNYIPLTLAMEIFDNPLKAGKFARGYAKRIAYNTFTTLNLPQTWREITGRKDLLRAKAKADPDSFLGQLFAFRAAGGSTEFNQGLNPDLAFDELFGQSQKKGLKGRAKQAYTFWNEATGNWAQVLENKGRVAAFTTLVQDMNYSPEEAAALVKSVMDFGQSGRWGRQINSIFAFYRVGATSVDVMRRIFTDPTGKPNWSKLAKWSSFMAAGGVAALAAMAAALGDDDDGVPRIKKYDINTLTQKLIIPTGDGNVASYPIGLGLPQILMAPGIIGGMLAQGHITAKEASNAMYEVITRNLPFQPAGWPTGSGATGFANSWIQGFAPTTVRPITEIGLNTNAFDAPIHTQNYNKNKFRADQGMNVTAEEWKELAKFVRQSTGGMVDMFPEDIRHMSKGYAGQLLSDIMRITSENDSKEQSGLDSMPVRSTLRTGAADEQYYYSRELKKTQEVLLNTRRRFNAAEEGGTMQEFNRNPANARRLAALKQLESAQKKYYDELNRIREANISAQGRRDRRKLADSALRRAVESAQRVIEQTE